MVAAPPPQPLQSRQTVYFSGRVQGVGFRYTVEQLASGFDVEGFVRNLADGRVELVIEGQDSQLAKFRSVIARELAGNIESEEVVENEPTGEFDGFRITL